MSGQKLSNNRVSIGEDLGNFEVAETIAKYPAGTVVMVYYNPRHPDRGRAGARPAEGPVGLPRHRHGDRACHRVRLGVRPQPDDYLAHHVGRPDLAGLVVGFGAFGLVIALMGVRCGGRRRWRRAGRWCRAPSSCRGSSNITRPASRASAAAPRCSGKRVTYTYRYQNVSYTNECARVAAGNAVRSDKM